MKKLALAILLASLGATANAVEVDASAGLVSNYVWRGATQSNGNPAIQAAIGLTTESGFYANAWGSQVDYENDTTAEIDFTAGYSNNINDNVSYDIGYIRYSYMGDDVDFGDDVSEVYGTLSLGPVSGTIYRDLDNDTNYYAGALSVNDIVDLPINLSGFVGRNSDEELDTGITFGNDFKNLSINYTWTNSDAEVEDSTHSVGIFYNF